LIPIAYLIMLDPKWSGAAVDHWEVHVLEQKLGELFPSTVPSIGYLDS
jgi:hypothetical protein